MSISFINQLGFNRASSIFLVGENLELHARFNSGSGYSFAITRIVGRTYYGDAGVKEACVPDSVLRVTESGGVTLLKLIFNDAKTSDDGVYSLAVSHGGMKKESIYTLHCTTNTPAISAPSGFKIFDSTKSGTMYLKSNVSGTVDFYNWLALDQLGTPYVAFDEIAISSQALPTLTFQPSAHAGNLIYLQAINRIGDPSEGAGQYYGYKEDGCYYGVCAKPAKGWSSSALPKEVALGAAVPISVTFPTAVPAGAQAYLVTISGKDAFFTPIESGSFNATRKSIALSSVVTSGVNEFMIYRDDTKEAKILGKVATVAAPTIGAFFPAGPITCKSGVKVKLVAPNTTGTPPVVVEWLLTSDAGKSWQSIGKGESIAHPAKSSGLISCRATNKFGTDFSDTMLTLEVSPRAVGVAKQNGEL